MPPLIPHTLLTPTFPSPPPTLPFIKKPHFNQTQIPRISSSSSSPHPFRCSLLTVATEAAPPVGGELQFRPSPAEVSRTIMELSSTGTLSMLTRDGWPVGVGARFVADPRGAPALCLNEPDRLFGGGSRSSFHVRFEQSGLRIPQCTLLGSLHKPEDEFLLKKLCAKWEKKFQEEVDEDLIYVISVERVLQMEDLKEEGIWVASSEYKNAEPDPLRNFAENIVAEMNSRHAQDVHRLCNVYVDSGFQVTDAKIIWVDRLGFDLYLYSSSSEVFAARIPFPREVTDQKGVKSSFNCMSHLAWEIEKNFAAPEFEKVKCTNKIK